MNRRSQALSRAVASVPKHKPSGVAPLARGRTGTASAGLGESVGQFLEQLRLGRYVDRCVAQGYCFAEDLTAAAATDSDEELATLFAALQLRKPEERRLRQALLDAQINTAKQGSRGNHPRRLSRIVRMQELVDEMLQPLQLGRYASLMSSKGYPFSQDVISAEDGAHLTSTRYCRLRYEYV